MNPSRSWRLTFAVTASAVLIALALLSSAAVRLERAELSAAAEARFQQSVRIAMWRLEARLSPLIARESGRPYYQYRPFHPQHRSWSKDLQQYGEGDVLTPSPLLSFRDELVRIHFQIEPDDSITSPEAPSGNERDLAEYALVPSDQLQARVAELEVLRPALTERLGTLKSLAAHSHLVGTEERAQMRSASAAREQSRQSAGASRTGPIASDAPVAPDLSRLLEAGPPLPPAPQAESSAERRVQSRRPQTELNDFQQRAGNAAAAQTSQGAQSLDVEPPPASPSGAEVVRMVEVGAMIGHWMPAPGGGEPMLVFLRGARVDGVARVQGFIVDWPRLRAELVAGIADLFPAATLTPCAIDAAGGAEELRLAAIPARLEPGATAGSGRPVLTFARVSMLAVAWLLGLAALVAVGFSLRAGWLYGEKRSRFASAVTHELRTPLTTFRMYSEMLAEGMAPPERHDEYIRTLDRESRRLADLVENVLAYARIEQGRSATQRRSVSLQSMLDSVIPSLETRVGEADGRLLLKAGPATETRLETDPDAVSRIIFNLVDNACKYGGNGAAPCVELRVREHDSIVEIAVADHGPGIDSAFAAHLFEPFERGHRGPHDPVRGLGLGLAISRGLARELGGDLRYERQFAGACFVLELPSS